MMTIGIPKPLYHSILMEAEVLRIEYKTLHGCNPRYWIISKRARFSIWNETKNIIRRGYCEDEIPKLNQFLGIPVLELEERVTGHFLQLV